MLEEPEPPRNAGPLDRVLFGLLRKDPERRVSAERARELLEAVRRELSGRVGQVGPAVFGESPRSPSLFLGPMPAPVPSADTPAGACRSSGPRTTAWSRRSPRTLTTAARATRPAPASAR
ncbi:hypothetical protein ACFQ9X_27875 [Catenulispora yoronensis]